MLLPMHAPAPSVVRASHGFEGEQELTGGVLERQQNGESGSSGSRRMTDRKPRQQQIPCRNDRKKSKGRSFQKSKGRSFQKSKGRSFQKSKGRSFAALRMTNFGGGEGLGWGALAEGDPKAWNALAGYCWFEEF